PVRPSPSRIMSRYPVPVPQRVGTVRLAKPVLAALSLKISSGFPSWRTSMSTEMPAAQDHWVSIVPPRSNVEPASGWVTETPAPASQIENIGLTDERPSSSRMRIRNPPPRPQDDGIDSMRTTPGALVSMIVVTTFPSRMSSMVCDEDGGAHHSTKREDPCSQSALGSG